MIFGSMLFSGHLCRSNATGKMPVLSGPGLATVLAKFQVTVSIAGVTILLQPLPGTLTQPATPPDSRA